MSLQTGVEMALSEFPNVQNSEYKYCLYRPPTKTYKLSLNSESDS